MKITLLLTLFSALLVPAVEADDKTSATVNPALIYWQAAALLPKISDEQAQELRDFASGKRPVDAQKLEALKLEGAERLMSKAAASSAPCDWGSLQEDGPEMVLPHLAKMREMANIA